MKIDEALRRALNKEAKAKYSKSTVASWKRRLNNGELTEKTMRWLLIELGYQITQEEEWMEPGGKLFYDVIFINKKGLLTGKTISAISDEDAKNIILETEKPLCGEIIIVNNASINQIIKAANKLNEL